MKQFKRILSLALALVLLWGVMPMQADAYTVTTNVIIEPQYEDAKTFGDGYAAVKVDGKWGFINEEGQMVVEPQYDWANGVSDGYAVVAKMESFMLPWGDEEPFEGLVYHLISMDGMDVTLMNPYGESHWGMEYPMFAYDLEQITSNSRTAYWYNYDGVVMVDGYAFDLEGQPILPKNPEELAWGEYGITFDMFTQTAPCVDGLIPMQAGIMGLATSRCFLMDTEGNIVKMFPASEGMGYESAETDGISWIYAPNDGLMVVYRDVIVAETDGEDVWYYKDGDRGGIMDMEGNWVIEPCFDYFNLFTSGHYFNDGLMCFKLTETGLRGAVNTEGETVIPFEYEELSSFANGYAAAKKDGKYVYLDTEGNVYQIAGPDGGIANITAASTFSSLGIAAVYDSDTDTCYCISTDALNGILPVVHGSEEASFDAYFTDYDGDGDIDVTTAPSEIIVIERNGKWGYAKLDLGYANPFADNVNEKKFYYLPILWAVDKGITTGKTATTFLPEEACTRAQIVTFLWRAMGEPEPEPMDNPFTDVTEGKYYYKAVMWAVQQGITTGKTATTFEPNSPCTRSQVVTFLWRTMDKPAHDQDNPFTDISVGKYYTNAVLWALENNITTGKTATTFLPDDTCTRGQIVTFLYRTLVDTEE